MNTTERVFEVFGVISFVVAFACLSAAWVIFVREWFGRNMWAYLAAGITPIFIVGYVSLISLAELL
jgi:hypothetical protein